VESNSLLPLSRSVHSESAVRRKWLKDRCDWVAGAGRGNIRGNIQIV
jgi:hypothetical protein